MKKALAIGCIALLMVSLTGCVSKFDTFQKAYDKCGAPEGITISDEGKTIVINGLGDEEYYGAELYDVICVVNAVQTPDYIIGNMETTNSMMGRQTDTFGNNIDVSWSYHPDNGLDIVYHKN